MCTSSITSTSHTAIELGSFGVAALIFYMAWPAVVAFVARRHTARTLSCGISAQHWSVPIWPRCVCAATFDGFSFPMYFDLQALIVGLIGAAWMIVHKEKNAIRAHQSGGH